MSISLPARVSCAVHGRVIQRSRPVVEAFAVLLLVLAALLVRLPELQVVPQFPSVSATVRIALELADGGSFPLQDQAPYIGAPFIYVLALAYRLFGVSVQTTMLVPLVLGTLTVIPTYLLAREIGRWPAGVLAAALLATSPSHTVISSHIALSHSMTPLLTTTTIWLIVRAARRRQPRLLPLAGLLAGLSLQSHPTALPLLMGSGAALIAYQPSWLRTRWLAISVVTLTLGYATLLMGQIQSQLTVVADIQSKQARYLDAGDDPGKDSERGVYVNNLGQLAQSLIKLTGGSLDDPDEQPGLQASDLSDWIYPALGIVGMVASQRRGGGIVLGAIVLGVLLPPLLSGKYRPILDGRYLMPLVPLFFTGIGALFSAAVRLRSIQPPRLVGAAAAISIAVVMIGHPVRALATFYEDSLDDGFSNAQYLRTLGAVQEQIQPGEAIALDPKLRDINSPGGGKASTNLLWMLEVSRVPLTDWAVPTDEEPPNGQLAIVHRSTAEELARVWSVKRLDRPFSGGSRASYQLVRISAR